jgi:hypothetical protein
MKVLTMTKQNLKKIATVAMAVGLFAAAAPSVKASLNLNLASCTYVRGYTAPSSAGSLLYTCNTSGGCSGLLKTSYNCATSLNTFNYCGGTTGQGTCFVLQCSNGGAYVWNISNWNGTDQIKCNFNPASYGCKDIQVYGNCKKPTPPPTPNGSSSVPEPSTIVAGALLLLPLGIHGFRQLRLRRQTA